MKKLYETITAENWTKRHVELVDGVGCIIGHVVAATGCSTAASPTIARINQAIAVLFPERVPDMEVDSWIDTGRFNDHPDTTLDDVIRVCKVADV